MSKKISISPTVKDASNIKDENASAASQTEYIDNVDDSALINADETQMNQETLFNDIMQKAREIEASEQYEELLSICSKNKSLIEALKKRIGENSTYISLVNLYHSEFSDTFINAILDTGWFDKYYDAICLFNNANESKEAREWSEAFKDVLEISINEPDSKKIKVLLNKSIPNTTFTLSLKTPYLRIKEGRFDHLADYAINQSRSFYGYLKNIEVLSLKLKDLWIQWTWKFPHFETSSKDLQIPYYLENLEEHSLSAKIENYIYNTQCRDNQVDLKNIFDDLCAFENKLDLIIQEQQTIYEKNERVLPLNYINEFLRTELEPIFSIYDQVQLSRNLLCQTYYDNEDNEKEEWLSLLDKLISVIESFLCGRLELYKSPDLIIGQSHIEEKYLLANNENVDYFRFADISAPIDSPAENMVGRVASISKYGFYRIESDNSITIIRKTGAAIYKQV